MQQPELLDATDQSDSWWTRLINLPTSHQSEDAHCLKSRNSTPPHYPRETLTHRYKNVLCSVVLNSEKLETTALSKTGINILWAVHPQHFQ